MSLPESAPAQWSTRRPYDVSRSNRRKLMNLYYETRNGSPTEVRSRTEVAEISNDFHHRQYIRLEPIKSSTQSRAVLLCWNRWNELSEGIFRRNTRTTHRMQMDTEMIHQLLQLAPDIHFYTMVAIYKPPCKFTRTKQRRSQHPHRQIEEHHQSPKQAT